MKGDRNKLTTADLLLLSLLAEQPMYDYQAHANVRQGARRRAAAKHPALLSS